MNERPQLTGNLAGIQELLGQMAARTAEALDKALHAFLTQDQDLAKAVKEGDADIDALQVRIEDLAAIGMATQQPVASDLRTMVAAIHVAGDLERAADYASHLAKATKRFIGEPRYKQFSRLETMARVCGAMIRKTDEAFRTRSVDLARESAAMDDVVDHEHKAMLNDIIGLIRERPETAEKAEKLLFTSSHLERLGDHMTNACESIVFMVSGERVDLNR